MKGQVSCTKIKRIKTMGNSPEINTIDSAGSDTRRKVILAGLIGNVMEWFDFAVYGYFASIIGTHFFHRETRRYH